MTTGREPGIIRLKNINVRPAVGQPNTRYFLEDEREVWFFAGGQWHLDPPSNVGQHQDTRFLYGKGSGGTGPGGSGGTGPVTPPEPPGPKVVNFRTIEPGMDLGGSVWTFDEVGLNYSLLAGNTSGQFQIVTSQTGPLAYLGFSMSAPSGNPSLLMLTIRLTMHGDERLLIEYYSGNATKSIKPPYTVPETMAVVTVNQARDAGSGLNNIQTMIMDRIKVTLCDN